MSTKKINSVVPVQSDYAQMGEQLTAQYKRALSGMVEVVKFGAMMIQVRSTLSNVDKVSTRGRPIDGNGIAGDGLKAWLEEFAPEIKRPTAYRFLNVAEAVAADYQEIVGKRIAAQYSLAELVTAENLPKGAQLKQMELFDYISGTSQRSWLSMFDTKTAKPTGGKRDGAGRPAKDLNVEAEVARQDWLELHGRVIEMMAKGGFIHLERAELEAFDGDLMDLRDQIKNVLKPKTNNQQ